jgi:hypothetical protein
MPANPYAKLRMVVDGGAPVTGGQTIAGGNVIQLSGESSVGWVNQLWEIYEYPTGFSLPAGWTNVNGVYQSTAVTPPSFTIPAAGTLWGKYFFRLTVNNGLLNGQYAGPYATQPLVDDFSAVKVLSPNNLHDIGFGESNQFDTIRSWIGDFKQTLRAIDTVLTLAGTAYSYALACVQNSSFKRISLTSNFTTTSASETASLLSFAANANEVWLIEFDGSIQCSSTGGVKASFTLPAGATIEGFAIGGTSGVTAQTASRITAGSALTSAFATVATTPLPLRVRARVKMSSTPGNITLNFASTTGGQTSTVFAGSHLRASLGTEV